MEHFIPTINGIDLNKEIEIDACKASQSEEDQTAYLLKSPANRERLLKAIENVVYGRNLVLVKLDCMNKYAIK
jgi:hypothetical protein